MLKALKATLRKSVVTIANRCGSAIIDHRTGAPLGRAFMFCWGGKVYFIGLDHALVPEFLPQKRLTYWKQILGFTSHSKPDFPNETRS
jgi:hypothetical protein